MRIFKINVILRLTATLTVLLLLAVLFMNGCVFSGGKGANSTIKNLTLMTWNVHNLFDGEDNGYEYNQFLQSSGWSTEKYLGRINTFSAAINKIQPMPDIIMLQEIEHLKVLEDLALSLQAGYSWIHFARNPGAAIGLGIISRIPLLDVKAHSITVNGDTAPRPVLEVRLQPGGFNADNVLLGDNFSDESFVIFICHWKSKLGGDAATEKIRRASVRVILRRIRELREHDSRTGIIVAGDLNLNHDEFYRQNALRICALLPDDPYSVKITAGIQNDFLVISKNKPPMSVHFPDGTIVLYSPWINELENGSYFFRNNWETIDHFLISDHFFNNTGWEYEKAFVVNYEPFADLSGIPIPYNPRTGTGLSDHLPLLITLKKLE